MVAEFRITSTSAADTSPNAPGINRSLIPPWKLGRIAVFDKGSDQPPPLGFGSKFGVACLYAFAHDQLKTSPPPRLVISFLFCSPKPTHRRPA